MGDGERLGAVRKADMDSSPGDLDLFVLPGEGVVVADELEVEREAIEWVRWRIFLRRSPPSPAGRLSENWPGHCLGLVGDERLVYLVLARCMTVLSRWEWVVKPWCTTETWEVDQETPQDHGRVYGPDRSFPTIATPSDFGNPAQL